MLFLMSRCEKPRKARSELTYAYCKGCRSIFSSSRPGRWKPSGRGALVTIEPNRARLRVLPLQRTE